MTIYLMQRLSNLALVARKNSVNLLRRHPAVGRTVVRMHSGIARQECACEDEHVCILLFSHGLTGRLTLPDKDIPKP